MAVSMAQIPHPSQKPLQTRGSCTPHSSDNLLGSEVRDAQVCPRPLASDGQAWAGVLLLSCSTWVPWPDSLPRAVVKWAA